MIYGELIAEELEELRALEKKQKLVQFEKRVQFLMARKKRRSEEAKSGGQSSRLAGETITKDLADVSGARLGRRVGEK